MEIPSRDWPFRLAGCVVEQYSFRRWKWEPLIGSKSGGYLVTSWTDESGTRRQEKVHRVTWILHYGIIPSRGYDIDHINGVKTDNRIENLRMVTHQRNIAAARERVGNWDKSKLKPHQKALVLAMPSNAVWIFWANRWDVSKNHLLNMRARAKARG